MKYLKLCWSEDELTLQSSADFILEAQLSRFFSHNTTFALSITIISGSILEKNRFACTCVVQLNEFAKLPVKYFISVYCANYTRAFSSASNFVVGKPRTCVTVLFIDRKV